MKIGDLAEHYSVPRLWGIILAVNTHEYEMFWIDGSGFWKDGERSWVRKEIMVKKCP